MQAIGLPLFLAGQPPRIWALPLLHLLMTALMGLALERIPRALRAPPPIYPFYGIVFALSTLGGWLLQAGLGGSRPWPAGLGALGFALALLLSLRALAWKLAWAHRPLSADLRP
jgi:hypothetical protein